MTDHQRNQRAREIVNGLIHRIDIDIPTLRACGEGEMADRLTFTLSGLCSLRKKLESCRERDPRNTPEIKRRLAAEFTPEAS